MSRPPSVDAEQIRAQIVSYLNAHDGRATQPEIRAHLVTEYKYSARIVQRYTAAIIRGPEFQTEGLARMGPRTIHVRLAPARRRRGA